MIHALLRGVEVCAIVGAIASIVYNALCLSSAARFLRDRPVSGEPRELPAISILKPLKGTDPEMYECFRSHCLQDYGVYEIIFGVSDPEDPAIELVQRLKTEFPNHAIQLVHCSEILGSNIKVSNLAQMLPHARYDCLIVNDSDIRVPPDYLRCVIAPLAAPEIGLVTCPYRGVSNKTLGSRLESLGISTDFFPGVLVARTMEPINFGLGSTLAFRGQDLEEIGGFEAIVDYLADDYEIGRRIAERGMRVELSHLVVESVLPRYTVAGFFAHQLRWARTIKNVRFWGYVGLVFTFGLVWALLALILARGAIWSWALLGITLAMRFGVAAFIRSKVLRESQSRLLWLLPLRDILAFYVWLMSFVGHTVTWRGTSYTLKQGKLARMTS
ncbi:MAG: bacteriohopanetetrol glucosamine biosynthesis glycosyltransferase HpnI [Acidobacteriaceae bacterium]|nr:bacteriohopanetetrol glucosamine biosynthesis glycosyltransferase HpnI [Acidobacteriaceae bacterium]